MTTVSDDKLLEIIKGCEGLERGPYEVETEAIPITCPGPGGARSFEHVKSLRTSWNNPQLKAKRKLVSIAVRGSALENQGAPMLWFAPELAAHFARLDPDTVKAMAEELLRLREEAATARGQAMTDISKAAELSEKLDAEAAFWEHDGSQHIAECFSKAAAMLRAQAARIAELEERLEISHAFDAAGNLIPFPEGTPDGIECRDETIKLMQRQLDELKEAREALEK